MIVYSGTFTTLTSSIVGHHVQGVRSDPPPRRALVSIPVSAIAIIKLFKYLDEIETLSPLSKKIARKACNPFYYRIIYCFNIFLKNSAV